MRFTIHLLVLCGWSVPLAAQDAWKKAGEFGKRLAEIKRDDPKAWIKLAQVAEKSGCPVEAEFCFASAVRLDPENAEARKKLGHAKKGDAWQTRVDQILARVDKDKVLFGLEWLKKDEHAARLKKEQADVGWTFERKFQGEHWTIYTDASDPVAQKILRVAEAVYDAFVAENAGLLPMAPPKTLRAYVFKDRDRFMKEANLPAAWAEGYYDGGKRACFCYYDPAGRNPYHWFVHEATHQLISELVVNCSGLNAWLSEGYACYFGTSRLADGRLKLGDIDPDTYPAWWRKQYTARLWKLDEFDAKIAPKFGELQDPNGFYLQSWLIVHYLNQGERRDAFRRFFLEAAQGRADTATFEKTVGKWADLQEGFTKYAVGLKP